MIILIAIGLVLCGIFIGWYLREWYAQRLMWALMKRQMVQAVLEAQEKKEEEKDTRKVMHITVSQHEGTYFVYEKGTNRFLAQGKSHQEIRDALNDRFDNTRFMASPENLEENDYDE